MLCEFWKAKLFKIQCFLVYLHASTALRTSGYSLLYLQSPMPCICTKLKPWIKGYRGLVALSSPTSPAQHRLTPHFPYPSQCMRSGFALRPFPSHSPLSVQGFYPTLIKRGDARSGFTTSSPNSYLKPKDISRATHIVILSRVEESQTKEPQHIVTSHKLPVTKESTDPSWPKRSPDKYLPIAEKEHTHKPLRQRF